MRSTAVLIVPALLVLLVAGCVDDGTLESAPLDEPEAPAGPAIVSLIPSSESIHVGEPLVVEVVIQNATDVGSVPFHLRYDFSVLQFVGPATEGPFMGSDGAKTVFLATDTGGGGEIIVGLSRMRAAQGATGSGTLAIFQFQAVAPGDAGFAFSGASVTDPQARPLPAAFNKAHVTVTP